MIVGPTGVGKTELALRLAEHVAIEVVGADSRQVYRYMDIGTAKPAPAQLAAVPHHAVSIVDPDHPFSLGKYIPIAHQAIKNVKSRGLQPIIVGGTGQYVTAIIESWDVPAVAPNVELRRELEDQLRTDGVDSLVERLREYDEVAADAVDSSNPRRIIRAIEVTESGGSAGRQVKQRLPEFRFEVVGLSSDRSSLYERIDRRVDEMMDRGFLAEVESLLKMGYGQELPAMSGIGYRELANHIHNGSDLGEAVDRMKFRTHRFIRQQSNWFSLDDPRIRWFDISEFGAAVDFGVRRAASATQA